MERIRLIGRGSRLSVLQMEKVAKKIESLVPSLTVEIITRSSRGDALQDIPLQTVEGSDFFTQDIFDALTNNEADIAVHSLKDMSSEHFFGPNAFAVVERNDTRDVAIFRKETEEKIRNGETIIIGTCSPRREEMATGFLQKALPQHSDSFKVTTKIIRGNVDTRLRKLDAGEYDGIILATAGLNRLLESEKDATTVQALLEDKKLMLLPLIECVPAPCQGAIVAEAGRHNSKAVEVLNIINDPGLMEACVQEKKTAGQYGAGCLQKFGVTSIRYGKNATIYAAGKDSRENNFSNWTGLPVIEIENRNLFSTTDFMGSFFSYQQSEGTSNIKEPVAYVANFKAAEQKDIIQQLQAKKVWASGTKTWYELSAKGIWVEGCADAFGLEFLQLPLQMPLFSISKNDVAVVTNTTSASIWRAKGWKVYSTYSTSEKHAPEIGAKIKEADFIFWTSYRQYQQYREVVKEGVQHACPYGETAEQLKAAGIDPVVFPNIKAFQQWKQTYIRSTNAA
jgi:hydroxymethylbilane synthase